MTNGTFEAIWLEYEPIVHSVAHEFGGKGRRWGADADDFRQEAIAWMLSNEHKLAEQRELIPDPDEFGRYLARCLRNEMSDYMLDVRDAAGGQPRQGAYFYQVNELKLLVPAMLDQEKWHEPPQSDGRSVSDPAHGGNWIATLADVSRAFALLAHEDQMLLRDIYEYEMLNKDLAMLHDVSEATMSRRHERALKRLLEKLGGEKPRYMRKDVPGDPWRGRRAISNAQARAITNGYYEED